MGLQDEPRKITETEWALLRLIQRSADIGDRWRQVSQPIWPVVIANSQSDLVELDIHKFRVRLTPDGEVLVRYAL